MNPYAFQEGCIARVDSILDTQGAPVKPGAREILTFLQTRGMKLAAASSSGQEAARGKPEPDIFLLAANEIGCLPEDCYIFEDSVNGIRAGIAAVCVTVMVPDLVQPPEGLAVSRVCASLNEVKALIEQGVL